jgi:hypothetical protein
VKLNFHQAVRFAADRVLYPAWLALRHHPRVSAGVVAGVAAVAALIWWFIVLRRPSAEEVERRRREQLAKTGRITDGVILDARTLDDDESVSATPQVLVYSYRIAGVTYHCAQDVSTLPELVRGYRLDQQVSVRFDVRHPGNSILVSESWSGLWQRG